MKEKFFMLVDDDYDDAELFVEALGELNSYVRFHHVDQNKNMFDFLNDDNENIPDILFLDINMNPVSGWESLASLKNDPAYKGIPVIMYSTSTAVRDYETAISSGAIGLLPKPSEFKFLVEILKTIAETEEQNLGKVVSSFAAS
jgi:CheY-like chemotaxis protein